VSTRASRARRSRCNLHALADAEIRVDSLLEPMKRARVALVGPIDGSVGKRPARLSLSGVGR
jgi:hypothetical protein